MSSHSTPIKPKSFATCAATLNYEDLETSIQHSITKKTATFKQGLTLFTYSTLKCYTYSYTVIALYTPDPVL